MKQQIILVGFKRVGKTHIGRQLAARLKRKFIDADQGISLFHLIENLVKSNSYVISLCDHEALDIRNQEIIKSSLVIHVTAASGTVFERIMMGGRPAFLHPDSDVLDEFLHLWNKRDPFYRELASYTVDNNHTLEDAVNQAIGHLQSAIAV